MTRQEKITLLIQAANALFSSKAQNTDIQQVLIHSPYLVPNGTVHGRWFKDSTTGQSTLRGFDFDIQDGAVVKHLRLIEQNPNKRDANGNLKPLANAARQGTQIAWLIDRDAQVNAFLGRMENGVFIPSSFRAAAPAHTIVPQSPTQLTTQSMSDSNIPTIDISDIPEYVEAALEDTDYEYEGDEYDPALLLGMV